MPIFRCPICNHKSFTFREEKEHAETHRKQGQQAEVKIEEYKPQNIIIKCCIKTN